MGDGADCREMERNGVTQNEWTRSPRALVLQRDQLCDYPDLDKLLVSWVIETGRFGFAINLFYLGLIRHLRKSYVII